MTDMLDRLKAETCGLPFAFGKRHMKPYEMKPYDKITIIRNRHRARDLRIFRDLVQTYFERSEHLTDDMLADWEGARAARSEINQMLPRVIQIVRAAGLETLAAYRSTPAADAAEVEILCNIFSPRYADGAEQEILDLIDMALGIYEASRFNALAQQQPIKRLNPRNENNVATPV